MKNNFYYDTEEDIKKCLECEKSECTNCLYYVGVSKLRSEFLKERNDKIMELFHSGKNGSQIAKLMKMDQSTVNSIIKASGGRSKI